MLTVVSTTQAALFTNIINPVKTEILNPIIYLLFALALLYFLWGVIRYIYNGDSDDARSKGQKHMIWGLIGMAIMLSVFGIMSLIFNSVTFNGTAKGVDNKPANTTKPGAIDRF